jgi:uroporphyrinogen III methyltransferase/synthase
MDKKGKVYLVGAGPGDAGLITVKGLEVLKQADVVLYDKLANPFLISYCRKDAEKIFVGKESGTHHVSQDETINILKMKAGEEKKVVRLKGGDPFIFGRGSEEAMALKEAGIEFEIVPGVTAASGASAYAGIPLTHRNLVTQCVFITAHETPDKEDEQVEWEKLATMQNTTLVIYMGVMQIKNVIEKLTGFGMPSDTPAAVIENGTLNSQRSFSTLLKNLWHVVESEKIKPPSIFIIGPTAAFAGEIKWFENKPLFGKRIVNTRAEDQGSTLNKLLTEKGADVISFNTISTELAKPGKTIKNLLSEKHYDWLIFTSENGVRYFFEKMMAEKFDARALGGIKVASIGSGTQAKLKEFNIISDFVPSEFTSESLAGELSGIEELKGKNILRVKGDFNYDPLTERLKSYSASVDTYEVYRMFQAEPEKEEIESLKTKGADAFLFTSMSTVNNFFSIIGNQDGLRLLNNSKAVVAIGPVTSEAIRKQGIEKIEISAIHTIEGMVETLINIFS